MHGVALHQAVSVFAGDAALNQIKQQLSAEDQAARASRFAIIRWDRRNGLDQVRRFVQQVVAGVVESGIIRARPTSRNVALVAKTTFSIQLCTSTAPRAPIRRSFAGDGMRLCGMADEPSAFR